MFVNSRNITFLVHHPIDCLHNNPSSGGHVFEGATMLLHPKGIKAVGDLESQISPISCKKVTHIAEFAKHLNIGTKLDHDVSHQPMIKEQLQYLI